ncbi:MAG: hypothetical protein M1420_01250 [Actinobacteria bacterium]|nr:hypothetical protein [Actinomycetota bacterium]
MLKGSDRSIHWISIPDADDDRTWMVDRDFMQSGWQCIYGEGCKGVLTAPAEHLHFGCCSHGAHLRDNNDAERVANAARSLTAQEWEHYRNGHDSRGSIRVFKATKGGGQCTRSVSGACIFLNGPSFPGGPGCALHRGALARKVHPLTMKPDVCWQLPIRWEDVSMESGHIISFLGRWDRSDWGEGGNYFYWWCTEAAEAYCADQALYRRYIHELTAIMGKQTYRKLVETLERLT